MAVEYAYDFGFDYNAAPVRVPQKKPVPQEKPELKRVKKPKQDKALQAQKAKKTNSAVVKFLVFVVFAVACFAVACNSFSSARDEKLKYKSQLDDYELYANQLVVVDAQLGTLVTPDKIVQIAVEKLGMIKLTDENKLYSSSTGENEIIVSQEK